MSGKLVFSTDAKQVPDKKKPTPGKAKVEGPLRVRLEKNGRGGKTVTVAFNLPFDSAELKTHKQALQGKLGCGATTKDNTIELQGDFAEKVIAYFTALGMPCKRSGG